MGREGTASETRLQISVWAPLNDQYTDGAFRALTIRNGCPDEEEKRRKVLVWGSVLVGLMSGDLALYGWSLLQGLDTFRVACIAYHYSKHSMKDRGYTFAYCSFNRGINDLIPINMPRPKRTKVAPSAPTVVPAAAMRFNSAVRESSSPGRTTTNSDDSQGIVKTIRKGARPKDAGMQMSGALAPEDVRGSTRLEPPSGRQRAALSRIAREADHARAIEALKKRRDVTMAKETAEQASEQVVVPSSMPAAQEAATQTGAIQADIEAELRSVERTRPVSALHRKVQATPGAESSVLALANFKRRPRQPSILHIGRQDTTVSESDSDLDEMLDDFQPDDESTPFHVSRLKPTTHVTPSDPSAEISSTERLSSSNSRKRKITPPEIQVPRSQSPTMHMTSSPPEPLQGPEVEEPYVISTTSPPLFEPDRAGHDLPSKRTRTIPAQDIWSDTMAPPQSSSPVQSPAKHQSTRSSRTTNPSAKPKSNTKRKQPTRKGDTDQSTRLQATRQKKEPLKPISTATLQNLLPRRRHRQRDDFDIPSSDEHELDTPAVGEDEDELSFSAPKSRRKTAGARTKQRGARVTRTPATTRKTPARAKSKAPAIHRKKDKASDPVRTYSRRVSDKENEGEGEEGGEGGDDSSEPDHLSDADVSDGKGQVGRKGEAAAVPAKVRATKELKTLAQKFKEVDAWEMEFEEVTASSSSPPDGR